MINRQKLHLMLSNEESEASPASDPVALAAAMISSSSDLLSLDSDFLDFSKFSR